MGITSSLFYSANDIEKQTLQKRITPTQDQFEKQQDRWNELADHLIADLKERSGYPMRTWLQGSCKFGTQVRPARHGDEFDIDLGVYFQWNGEANDGGHSPLDLKEMVQDSLLGYTADGVKEVVAPPKMRCSRIRFDDSFHIDVPGYHLAPDRDARMLATQDDEWEDSDPKALYVWFKYHFDDQRRTKVRRQIRYLKIWAGLKFPEGESRPSSTLLTVLAAEAADELDDDDFASDDDALLALLEEIVDRLENDSTVPNPADKAEDLASRLSADDFEEFRKKLTNFRDIAADALACDNIVSAADKWSEAFDHFFPMPEEEDLEKAVGEAATLPVRLIIPEIHVRAVAQANRDKRWEDMNCIGPIPRNCDIYFTLTNPEIIPENAVVEWTVRNEGDEAEDTNDLGHKAGRGMTAKEHSAYKGVHYMDCVVRQYGMVVGMRRIPVEISGMFTPRRNPKKRPAWVAHRGRR